MTVAMKTPKYHRSLPVVYPVTVHCLKCFQLIEIDAEFIDNKFIHIVPTRQFTEGYKGYIHHGCGGDCKIFLPSFLKF